MLVIALACAAATALVAWHRAELRQTIRASVPERPDLTGWPAALVARIEACERRAREVADQESLGELAGLYHANGFLAEAAVAYDGLCRVDPGHPRWAHRLAHILAGYGRVEEAIPLWRRVVDLEPEYIPVRLRLADALLKANRAGEAAASYREAVALEPENAYALLGLARVAIGDGRWTEARALLEDVVRVSDYQLGYDLLPTVYERLGDVDRARAIRGRIKASGAYRDPEDPWIDELGSECYDVYRLLMLAGAAGYAARTAEAFALLERAVALAPESGTAHYQLGVLALNTREYTRARRHLERAVQLAPDLADAWGSLAFLAATVGDAAGAERALEQGLSHCPESAGLHLDRGRRRAALGRHEEAVADLKTAARLRAQDPDAALELARLLIRLGRSDEAANWLREALRIEPDNTFALTTLALYAIGEGDAAEARECLQRIRAQPRIPAADVGQIMRAFERRFGAGSE